MSLRPKQQAFLREYLLDFNATQAAIRAGYRARTARAQASALLKHPAVQQELARLEAERERRLAVDADYVIAGLREIAERCLQRAPVMTRPKDAKAGKNLVQAEDEAGRHVWEFNVGGATKALEMIGRHLGMFRDRLEPGNAATDLASLLETARRRVGEGVPGEGGASE